MEEEVAYHSGSEWMEFYVIHDGAFLKRQMTGLKEVCWIWIWGELM